ncbi:MAG: SulP family inorganic anion transporter, partial [Bdellovibrionales bacterium]|nr:SulP family inorganic anion transporter [Bdellovibrionales bacterium]
GMLIALLCSTAVAVVFDLPIATIGSRYGGIPQYLPAPSLPPFHAVSLREIFPDALAFALLGGIESLLSAVVADGMSGRRHRSNCELVAQGFANIGSALFGGICVTGTIARTATNVRSGAHGPISGMIHSILLLFAVLLFAPYARFIPLSALAGVLLIVSWNMIEKHAFFGLLRSSWQDAFVVLLTLLLTLFVGLTEAILVGVALGSLFFIEQMSSVLSIADSDALFPRDSADDPADAARAIIGQDPETVIYRITGVLFFAAAPMVSSVLDRISDQRKNFVLDFSAVPFIDSTAASVIAVACRKANRAGRKFMVSGANPQIQKMLQQHGVSTPFAEYL